MLLTVLYLLAAVLAAVVCMTLEKSLLLILWFVLLWVGFSAALIVGYLLSVFLFSFFLRVDPKNRKDPKLVRKLLEATLRALCRFTRTKITLIGEEKLPDVPFLLVSNHRSDFDPIVTVAVLKKRPLAFITKPAILKVPLVGRVASYCNFISIDRENPRAAIRTINEAAGLLKDGICSVGVYPEGTRNRSEQPPLLPFHDGVLMIAQKANAPIVVAAIKNAEKVSPNFKHLKKTHVTVDICDVLDAQTVVSSRTGELSERVQADLLHAMERN